MLRRAVIIAAVLGLLVGVGGFWMLWLAPGPKSGPHTIVAKEGSTLGYVAAELHEAGAIPGSARSFGIMARLFGSSDPIQSGEFEIPKGTGGAAILDLLQHGRPVQRLITVTEGMPSIIVAAKLDANSFLTGATPPIGEGTVLPDSYSFERGESRAAVVQRMQAAMSKTLDQLMPKNSGKCPVSSRQDVVTLASIVEKETGKASERRTVAGVYCNRLRIGMPLQADPTVQYALGTHQRRLLYSHIADVADNPYNTYTHAGLPPGPIASPSEGSIRAVLQPADVPYLYFVARPDGTHVFTRSLAEHNNAKNRIRRELNESAGGSR